MELVRNNFKKAIAEGRVQIGLWSSLCSNIGAEVVADAGFDWILLDGEHSPNDVPIDDVANAGAGRRHRVADRASGLERRGDDQAHPRYRRAVDPRALRAERRGGASARSPRCAIRRRASAASPSSTRANHYGRVEQLSQARGLRDLPAGAGRDASALGELEAIAKVEGVDGVFIGPSDLAASLGHIGNPAHAEVQAALEDAVKRLKAVGKAAGILTLSEEEARRYIGWGYTFVAVGSDIGLLGRGADALAKKFKT